MHASNIVTMDVLDWRERGGEPAPGAVQALPAAPEPTFRSSDAPEPKKAYGEIQWSFPEFGIRYKIWSGIPKFGASEQKPVS